MITTSSGTSRGSKTKRQPQVQQLDTNIRAGLYARKSPEHQQHYSESKSTKHNVFWFRMWARRFLFLVLIILRSKCPSQTSQPFCRTQAFLLFGMHSFPHLTTEVQSYRKPTGVFDIPTREGPRKDLSVVLLKNTQTGRSLRDPHEQEGGLEECLW